MELSFSDAKGMFASLVELIKKGSQLEAQKTIQELREGFLQLHAENIELKQELLEMRIAENVKENMIFDEPFYYLLDENDKKDGPFCPKCWEKDEKKCRVINTPTSYTGKFQCQVCHSSFGRGKPIPRPKPLNIV
jgi:hypothetical protein